MDRHAFMRACRDGGPAIEQALRTLDQSFFAVLYRECVRSLRDRESARDLVQETFIRVWQRCASFHGDSELLPWIRAILRHILLDRLRRPEREVAMDPEGSADPEIEQRIVELSQQRVPTPADAARHQQLAECFQRCWESFRRAAPSHAAVMTWIVDDGLSNEEISELLGRSPGATREFVSQCRKRARVHFAEWYELAFGSG